jgi:cell division GTPase FtsZ
MERSWGSDLDYALICVGLGGGTGSGLALPVPVLRMARRYMEAKKRHPRVGCVVSLPSTAEGQIICHNAVWAFGELVLEKASPIIIIDNARVNDLYRPVMSQLLPKSNELVSHLLHNITASRTRCSGDLHRWLAISG